MDTAPNTPTTAADQREAAHATGLGSGGGKGNAPTMHGRSQHEVSPEESGFAQQNMDETEMKNLNLVGPGVQVPGEESRIRSVPEVNASERDLIGKLQAALEDYGGHLSSCDRDVEAGRHCDCGFDDALRLGSEREFVAAAFCGFVGAGCG